MVLREVKPLNAKQWKQLTDALTAGPTPEQRQFRLEALEIANNYGKKRIKIIGLSAHIDPGKIIYKKLKS